MADGSTSESQVTLSCLKYGRLSLELMSGQLGLGQVFHALCKLHSCPCKTHKLDYRWCRKQRDRVRMVTFSQIVKVIWLVGNKKTMKQFSSSISDQCACVTLFVQNYISHNYKTKLCTEVCSLCVRGINGMPFSNRLSCFVAKKKIIINTSLFKNRRDEI